MKNIYQILKISGITLFAGTILFSCSDYLDVNEDPDSPEGSQISEEVLLPGILSELTYELTGGYPARTSSVWTAQIAVTGESRGVSTLVLLDTDINNTWEYTLYTGVLKNAKLLEEKATESESPQYLAVSRIVQAYGLSIAADFWGQAPWSEAFNEEIEKPKFDTQEELYTAIDNLLAEALTNLDQAVSSGATLNEDLLYDGDLSKWKKLVYSLRARYAMRLIYAKGDGQADLVLSYLNDGFSSNADDARFVFDDKENANNPWVQWEDKWTDVYINKFMVELLSSNTDPRLDAFALKEGTGNIIGGENGTEIQQDSVSLIATEVADGDLNGAKYYIENETAVDWMSYSELMFLASEAYLFKGDMNNAETYMRNGVKANLERIDDDGILDLNDTEIDDFANGLVLPAAFEDAQKMIIEQKYITNFLKIEPYHDYRRTGYPEVPMPVTAFNSQIPVRFPYSTSPTLNNTENVPDVNYVIDKVWWDQK